MRVLVCGAGVIGQIYGGRLAAAGNEVTLLARGPAAESLATHGVALVKRGETSRSHPAVTTEFPLDVAFDAVFVTVRRDQLADVLPMLAASAATRIVFMLNEGVDLDSIRDRVGTARCVFAFPGVGGKRTDAGSITYLEIRQQQTTVEDCGGVEAPVVDMLRSAGFAVEVCAEMAGWLKTHTVFVTVVGAAIIAGGTVDELTSDRTRMAEMVAAVGDGFRALARQGVTVTPTPLRIIFTAVPRFIAVRYWQGQLRGPLGTLAIAPHVAATRDTEFPAMVGDVRLLVAGHGPTPHLDRLLLDAADPVSARTAAHPDHGAAQHVDEDTT